jgi:arylsulfatase A-like enzyme
VTRRTAIGCLGAAALAAPGPESRRNLLFIAIDDLNDWIGCLNGHPGVMTPNLDRLAKRGTLFTSAHCAAPVCNPSRAALMYGKRPSNTGVYTNNQPHRRSPVLENAATLPMHFMQNGYRAIGGGKIFHERYPDARSWDEYFPSKTKSKPPDPQPDHTPLNGMPGTANFDWGGIPNADMEMGDYKVADWARGELSKTHDKPFFLACGIYKPHLPWYIPQKYLDMYPLDKITLPLVKDDDLDDIPPIGRQMAMMKTHDHERVKKYKQWETGVRSYMAAITFADAQVGRVLDALDAGPNAANTNIVLWSDHGWHLGEKLHWRKFTLWERSTRNVLMMSAPGLTKPGSRCDRTVSLLDIYPTLTEMFGLPPREGLDGRSLMPLLKNPSAPWDHAAITTYPRGNHSVRDARWRYIRYHDGTEELYDRDKDPNEWTNIAAQPAAQSAKTRLARALPPSDAPDVPSDSANPEGEAE